MCGIVGYWDNIGVDTTIIENMVQQITHRGPDGAGIWISEIPTLALGHRRLSIVDLTQAGYQPMLSSCKRFVITFNGEIYNHLKIRAILNNENSGFNWRGHSDTETLITALQHWGIEKTLKKLEGMFAFALWDKQKKILTLGRDRLGEKPLYYGWQNKTFMFASELKAFKKNPNFIGEIDREAISLQMRHSYIPAPFTIYKNIRKLTPGCYLNINFEKMLSNDHLSPVPYWSFSDTIKKGQQNLLCGSETDAIDGLDILLTNSVHKQMMSDVPVGAFLSGGIDSSLITALMQINSNKPINTFTIGFNESDYSEAIHAKLVSEYLGTNHNELYLSHQDALDIIPQLPTLYDEPFSDASQIPTFLLSKMTRDHVTVSLSGDGGDELFGGYNRYVWSRSIWQYLNKFPLPIRKIIQNILMTFPPLTWNKLIDNISHLLPRKMRFNNMGDKIHKLANLFDSPNQSYMYSKLISHWDNTTDLVLGLKKEPHTILSDNNKYLKELSFTENMMYIDSISYLPDDILVKVDRASMGVSLETRVPFLDHNLIEFSWKIPLHMKILEGEGKWLLKEVLYKYVPRKLVDRPKMGFGIPIDSWLRGPLREWGESLLDENKLRKQGYLNPEPIRKKWSEHQSGNRNWQYHLWDVLMFQSWLDNNS